MLFLALLAPLPISLTQTARWLARDPNVQLQLVKHVSGTGKQGDHMIKNMLDDKDMDDRARHFMSQYGQGNNERAARAPRRRRGGSVHLPVFAKDGSVLPGDLASGKHSHGAGGGGDELTRLTSDVRDKLDSWALDMEGLKTDEEREAFIVAIFDAFDLVPEFVDRETLLAFIRLVKDNYNDTPYHNWRHVCDVTHTVYRYLSLTEDRVMPSQLEKFAMLVAGLAHDLNHPGITNNFLVTTRDPKAIKYNDSSVLENHHVSTLYQLMADYPEADVFKALDDADWLEARKLVITVVLHTDMVHHFKSLSQLEVFYELNTEKIKEAGNSDLCICEKSDERELIFSAILHSADISNPVKPMAIYSKWKMRVLEEFWQQGDQEKARGLKVSPQMDRDNTSIPQSQINFIDFIVAPMYKAVVYIFPELQATLATLCTNRRILADERIEELRRTMSGDELEVELGKVHNLLRKFQEKYTSENVFASEEPAAKLEAEGVLSKAVRRMSVSAAPPLFRSDRRPSANISDGETSGSDDPARLPGGGRKRGSVFGLMKHKPISEE